MALRTWVFAWLGVAALIAVGLTILAQRKQDDLESYLLSDWNVGVVVIAATAIASWVSGSAYVGTPGAVYAFGFSGAFYFGFLPWLGFIIGVALNAGPMQRYSKAIHALSISELLERRYDSTAVRILSSVFLLVFFIPNMLAQARAGSFLLQVTAGLSEVQALAFFGVLMVIIVAVGGFRGVAWTDAALLFAMVVVAVVVLGVMFAVAGGPLDAVGTMIERSSIHGELIRPPLFQPVASVGWFLAGFVGGMALPRSITRYMGMEDADPETLRKLMLAVLVFSTVVVLYVAFAGIAAFVALPEPVENPDLVVPTLIETYFPDVVGGLITTAILGAIITTLSTLLLLVTTAFTRDVLQGWIRPEMGERRAQLAARLLTVVIVAGVVFLATFQLRIIVLLQAVTFVTLGLTFFMILTVGFYWRSANKYGAAGAIIAMAIAAPVLNAGLGMPIGEVGAYAFVIVGAVFVLGSVLTGGADVGDSEFFRSSEEPD
jgi:sodium/pantothenate symporter